MFHYIPNVPNVRFFFFIQAMAENTGSNRKTAVGAL